MRVCVSVCLQFLQQSQILTSVLSAPLFLSSPHPSVLIGSISVVVVKWVLMWMCTGLMDGIFHCSIFLLILQSAVPLWTNLQHAPLFPSPEGWNVGIVGRKRERERDRDRPFTICGSVSWMFSEPFCRAICSSLGRQQAKLLGRRENKEGGLKQECQGVMCLRA